MLLVCMWLVGRQQPPVVSVHVASGGQQASVGVSGSLQGLSIAEGTLCRGFRGPCFQGMPLGAEAMRGCAGAQRRCLMEGAWTGGGIGGWGSVPRWGQVKGGRWEEGQTDSTLRGDKQGRQAGGGLILYVETHGISGGALDPPPCTPYPLTLRA